MLEFFTRSDEDAIAIIKADHEKVKDLFEKFEKAESLREKKKIAAEAIMELKIHASIEEEIFYPTVRKHVGKKVMNEADEEHHVAKLLIAELDQMDGSEDHYEAKFTVLAENIRHHIREEESEMLPESREVKVNFENLGKKMLARKQQLMKNGVPASSEEKLMKGTKGRIDSPADNAKRTKPKTVSIKTAKKSVKSSTKKPLFASKAAPKAKKSMASRSKTRSNAKRA